MIPCEQVLPTDEEWIEASRFANRIPIGSVEVGENYATHIGWFGRWLPFMHIHDDRLAKQNRMVTVGIGLGVDRWITVQVADMDVLGMRFIREANP